MKKTLIWWFFGGALLLMIAADTYAKTATSSTRSSPKRVVKIKDVRTVYVRRIVGDREFARRLINEMRSMNLRFVTSPRAADALFFARGEYTNGAFYGSMKFVGQNGRVLWSAKATRPKGSNYMAYSRLADQLRAALR